MKTPKTELVSRAGVHYAGYVFSMSGITFKETSSSDVGIDGQLELVNDEGLATGITLEETLILNMVIESIKQNLDY